MQTGAVSRSDPCKLFASHGHKLPIPLANAMLAEARKLTAPEEILLWLAPSDAPKALQAPERRELPDPTGTSRRILAHH